LRGPHVRPGLRARAGPSPHAASNVDRPGVFSIGGDPIQLGFAASLNRPGGNMTGVIILALNLEAKLLILVHELAPKAATVGILLNPANRRGICIAR
jgi:ABC-type uncharacterized transport system substrate-binding protein